MMGGKKHLDIKTSIIENYLYLENNKIKGEEQ